MFYVLKNFIYNFFWTSWTKLTCGLDHQGKLQPIFHDIFWVQIGDHVGYEYGHLPYVSISDNPFRKNMFLRWVSQNRTVRSRSVKKRVLLLLRKVEIPDLCYAFLRYHVIVSCQTYQRFFGITRMDVGQGFPFARNHFWPVSYWDYAVLGPCRIGPVPHWDCVALGLCRIETVPHWNCTGIGNFECVWLTNWEG